MFARRVLGAIVLTAIFFATRGYSQCYNDTTCTGNVIPATDRKGCCVRTEDGLSFSEGGTCRGCIVHGFPRTVYNVVESMGIGADSREGRLDTVFKLNVKGNGGPLFIAGMITAEEDGATVDDDFERLSPPISVDLDLNSDPVEIRLFMENDDISLEYNESIILRFTTPDDPNLIADLEAIGQYIRDTARVNIIDNDQLQINFEQADYEIVEGSTERPRIFLRFRTVQNPFTITIRPVDIDTLERENLSGFITFMDPTDPGFNARAIAGVDFSSMAMTFTVPQNADSFDISNSFTVADDDINEIDQSFALVAELGPEVPDDLACFQIRAGDTECFGTGRLGATEIKITDNDVMVIGFQQRYVTVCECDADPGDDQFVLPIGVNSNITSEQNYTVQIRVLQSTTPGSQRACVGPLQSSNAREFDVIFGNEENNVIRSLRKLRAGNKQFSESFSAAITNDFVSEEFECFTMRIATTDDGNRRVFNCTSDSEPGDNFFCQTTICIVDDYGVISIIGGVSLTLDSDLNGPTPQFTLTCISTGRPATTVTWTRDSTTVTQGTQTVLNDPVTAQYTHTLTVTGELPGLYKCTVANNKPSLASASFIIPAEPDSVAFEPVNGTAVRISLNVNSAFPTTLHHISISNLTGAVMSESSLVLPAGTTSATVVLEEDVGLDDGIDEYEHIFTLYQIIFHGVRGFGTTETFTFDKNAFQVQFGPIGYCVDWGVKKALHIEEQLQSQLIRIIRKRTNSSNGILTTPFLRKGLFLCHGNPTKTTYRTTLVNPFHTTSSTHLVGIIQSWVSTGPSLVLDGLLVRVSPSCPTSISSLDEEECETGTSHDPRLGERITQTLNVCAVRNLGEKICSLGGC